METRINLVVGLFIRFVIWGFPEMGLMGVEGLLIRNPAYPYMVWIGHPDSGTLKETTDLSNHGW